MVADFLRLNTYGVDDAKTPIKILYQSFRDTLEPGERLDWPRWKFIAHVSRLHPVGVDGDRILCAGGISLKPPRKYVLNNGKLRLAS